VTETNPPSADLPGLARFAEMLADAAGAAVLPFFRSEFVIENKAGDGDFDPVTEADRAAETAIREKIEAAYPDHGIEGEEYPGKRAESDFTWTLDPIDGTRAFMCGLPSWTTLIALSWRGKPVLGIIDQPYLRERFIGFEEKSVLKHGGSETVLRTKPCEHLRQAALSTTDPKLFTGGEPGAFEQIRCTARVTRYGLDAYAYAMLAHGGLDLVIEAGLSAHDVRALIPVVEGAGGIITDWRGGDPSDGGQIIAAGDARLHDQAMVSLRRAASF